MVVLGAGAAGLDLVDPVAEAGEVGVRVGGSWGADGVLRAWAVARGRARLAIKMVNPPAATERPKANVSGGRAHRGGQARGAWGKGSAQRRF
jgi:hypothetical protein